MAYIWDGPRTPHTVCSITSSPSATVTGSEVEKDVGEGPDLPPSAKHEPITASRAIAPIKMRGRSRPISKTIDGVGDQTVQTVALPVITGRSPGRSWHLFKPEIASNFLHPMMDESTRASMETRLEPLKQTETLHRHWKAQRSSAYLADVKHQKHQTRLVEVSVHLSYRNPKSYKYCLHRRCIGTKRTGKTLTASPSPAYSGVRRIFMKALAASRMAKTL